MNELKLQELKQLSFNVRNEIIDLTARGGCFIGASLSCVELIVYLYTNYLNINKDNLDNPDRDYFLLSKGHDVPTLYSTLAEIGIIEKSRLLNHTKVNDDIYWHPNRNIPGVEFHSGSLGHLLSVGIGIAYDIKSCNKNNKVIVLMGDGELNEGSNWEALLVASAYKLDNLVIIVDRNKFQANMKTEDLIPLEPLGDKFTSFGCNVERIDGHDFEKIENAFAELDYSSGKPSVIIADTIRGKGLPSIEEKADRWFCKFTEEETEELKKELTGQYEAKLESQTIIAR